MRCRMRALTKVGPVRLAETTSSAYLAMAGDALAVEFAPTDEEGLSRLLAKSDEPVVCDLALSITAKALGLPVAPLSQRDRATKTSFAAMLALGSNLALEDVDLLAELASALADFAAAAPWTTIGADEAIAIEVCTPALGRPREGRVVGQGGEAYGLVLYDSPGSVRRLRELVSAAGDDERWKRLPATSILAVDGPAYLVEAIHELTGTSKAPWLARVEGGRAVAVGDRELAAGVASLRAVAALARGRPGVGVAEVEGGAVTARASSAAQRLGSTSSQREPSAAAALREPLVVRAGGQSLSGSARNAPCPCGSGRKSKLCHAGRAIDVDRTRP